MKRKKEVINLLGNIVGFENYSIGVDSVVRNIKFGREVKTSKSSKGYLQVGLWREGKVTNKLVHRLVGEAFIPNPENKPFINHINNIRTDNRLENLEWVTAKENTQHSVNQGRMRFPNLKGEYRGSSSPRSKLNENEVKDMRILLSEGVLSRRDLAALFNISQTTVSDIKLGKRWSHL